MALHWRSFAAGALASAAFVGVTWYLRHRSRIPKCSDERAEPTDVAAGAGSARESAKPSAKGTPISGSSWESLRGCVVEADLTWVDGEFRSGVRVKVDERGMIVDVRGEQAAVDEEPARRMVGVALLPGFVNCHSHAFQRGLRGKGEHYPASKSESSFWTWREEMYKLVSSMNDETMYRLTRQCFDEMRANGITSVGEFHYFHHSSDGLRDYAYDKIVIQAAVDAGIRIALLTTFYCFGGFKEDPLSTAQRRFATPSLSEFWGNVDRLQELLISLPVQQRELVTIGVVAHSLRAVNAAQLGKLRAEAKLRGLIFHLHIEEQPREVTECLDAHGKTPMQLLLESAKVDAEVTAVHCNHTRPAELKSLVATGAHVCICPLTEGNLGDGLLSEDSARVVLASRDIDTNAICLGTDCNARIDMLEEMRWLEYGQRLARLRRGIAVNFATGTGTVSETHHSEHAAVQLLKCATSNGAASLKLDVGTIARGCWADFTAIDLGCHALAGSRQCELLESLVFGASAEGAVVASAVAGDWSRPRQTQSRM